MCARNEGGEARAEHLPGEGLAGIVWDVHLRHEAMTPSMQSLGKILSRDGVRKGWQKLHAPLELVKAGEPSPRIRALSRYAYIALQPSGVCTQRLTWEEG